MIHQPPSTPRRLHLGRILGWAFLTVHTALTAAIWISLGSKGSEWLPVLFYPMDYPISIPIFIFFRQVHWYSTSGMLLVFAVLGGLWHFAWPQVLARVIDRLTRRGQPEPPPG